jgi:hypothetical protein
MLIKKYKLFLKELNKNSGDGKYNDWNEKFTRRPQHQIWSDIDIATNFKVSQLISLTLIWETEFFLKKKVWRGLEL